MLSLEQLEYVTGGGISISPPPHPTTPISSPTPPSNPAPSSGPGIRTLPSAPFDPVGVRF